MAYKRENAVRLVLDAVKPHLEPSSPANTRPFDEMVQEALLTMEEEPAFGEAFDAMVKAIWDTAWHYAKEDTSPPGGGGRSG